MDYTTITFFKNLTPTFFTFRKFYTDLWDVTQFIYIIGYTDNNNYNNILENYINKVGNTNQLYKCDLFNYPYFKNMSIIINNDNRNVNNIFILYETNNSSTITNFNHIKNITFNYIVNNFISDNKRYICLDDDEFLFHNNINKLKKQIETKKYHRFHFIEIICDEITDKLDTLNWCFQSWFTHRMNDKNIGYNCSACKTFFFMPDQLKQNKPWIHSNNFCYNNSSCEIFMNTPNKTLDLLNVMKNTGICYHFTAYSFNNLCKIKLKNRFNSDKEGNYKDILTKYKKVNEYFDNINDNTLLNYFCDEIIY